MCRAAALQLPGIALVGSRYGKLETLDCESPLKLSRGSQHLLPIFCCAFQFLITWQSGIAPLVNACQLTAPGNGGDLSMIFLLLMHILSTADKQSAPNPALLGTALLGTWVFVFLQLQLQVGTSWPACSNTLCSVSHCSQAVPIALQTTQCGFWVLRAGQPLPMCSWHMD